MAQQPPTRAGGPPLTQGDRSFGEFMTFGLLAALFFGVVLGIPYVYRLLTSSWASPSWHPQTAITGTWVGVLAPPPLEGRKIERDPFWSEQSYQESLREQARLAAEHRKLPRAIYLDLGLDPFTLGSPKLRGTIRMCAYNGAVADFQFTSMSVGDEGGHLILTTKVSDEVGNLDFQRQDVDLQTKYSIMDQGLTGTLTHGSTSDFQAACDRVKADAEKP